MKLKRPATCKIIHVTVIVFICVFITSPLLSAEFKNGDILLQHMASRLSSVISDVTHSRYSHCGMVVLKPDGAYVIEAVGPVKYTPADIWIDRGINDSYAQFRPVSLSGDQIKKAIAEAEKLLGLPYDIQYEMDDEKIYCSELVYKAFLRGCNIRIGSEQTLGSLDWKPHETFIRHIAGGDLPLDRVMVTPESLTHSRHLTLVYSNETTADTEPGASPPTLEGTWVGDYTIKTNEKAYATIHINNDNSFKKGQIKLLSGAVIPVTALTVSESLSGSDFQASLTDARGVHATLYFKLKDNGQRLIGTWNDNYGYSGVFSLCKQPF